jgi:PGF-pre-PGF domain-containing protein
MNNFKVPLAFLIVILLVPAIAISADISKTKVVSGFSLNVKKVIELDEKELPVTTVSILPTKDLGTIQLTVSMLEKTPYTLVSLEKPVSYYLSVEAVNPKEDDIGYVTFAYKVEKEWMESLGLKKEDISMYRYSDRKWNELATLHKNTDGSFEYFESISPGFSFFAISTKPYIETTTTTSVTTTTVPRVRIINTETTTTAKETTTTKKSTTTTKKGTTTTEKTTTTTTLKDNSSEASPEGEEDKGSSNTNSLLLGIVIIIIAAISFTHFLQSRTTKSKIGKL